VIREILEYSRFLTFVAILPGHSNTIQVDYNILSACSVLYWYKISPSADNYWAELPNPWEYVTVQGLKGLKCAVVYYFQGTIFNSPNLLNHVAPSIKLMMQM